MKRLSGIKLKDKYCIHTFMLHLDKGCIPKEDERKVFSIVDRSFNLMGTAAIVGYKGTLVLLELFFPDKSNATVMYKQVSSSGITWGRANNDLNIFCVEVDIINQAQ